MSVGRLAWLPNALSASRFLWALLFPFTACLGRWAVVAIAGLTDALDGYCARRLGCVSRTGQLLDAAADKFFLFAVSATFLHEQRLTMLEFIGIAARDLVVTFGAAVELARGRPTALLNMPARLSGKIATAGQFVLLLALLADGWGRAWLIPIVVMLSVLAAADYAAVYCRQAPAGHA